MIWYKYSSSQFNWEGSVQLSAIVSSANVIIIGSFKDIIERRQQHKQLLRSIASILRCYHNDIIWRRRIQFAFHIIK